MEMPLPKTLEHPHGAPPPVVMLPPRTSLAPSPPAAPSPSAVPREDAATAYGGVTQSDGTVLWVSPNKVNDDRTPVKREFLHTTGEKCEKCRGAQIHCLVNDAITACWRCHTQKLGCSFVEANKAAKAKGESVRAAAPKAKEQGGPSAGPSKRTKNTATARTLSGTGEEDVIVVSDSSDGRRADRGRGKKLRSHIAKLKALEHDAEVAFDEAGDVAERATKNVLSRKRKYTEAVDNTRKAMEEFQEWQRQRRDRK